MSIQYNPSITHHADAFSVATLLYARLRRVSGRVIDVIYLVENQQYARQIAELALDTEDTELIRLVNRLDSLMDILNYEQVDLAQAKPVPQTYADSEVTEEEIYRAQVSHHYIGALR